MSQPLLEGQRDCLVFDIMVYSLFFACVTIFFNITPPNSYHFFILQKALNLISPPPHPPIFPPPYQSPKAGITKYHRLGVLQREMCFLTVLDTGNLRSRCWQGCSFLSPLLIDGSSLLLVSSRDLPSPCVWILTSSSNKDTGHIELGSPLMIQYFLILSLLQSLCLQIQSHSGGQDFNIWILGEHSSTFNTSYCSLSQCPILFLITLIVIQKYVSIYFLFLKSLLPMSGCFAYCRSRNTMPGTQWEIKKQMLNK